MMPHGAWRMAHGAWQMADDGTGQMAVHSTAFYIAV
jgi:hypothetical protein